MDRDTSTVNDINGTNFCGYCRIDRVVLEPGRVWCPPSHSLVNSRAWSYRGTVWEAVWKCKNVDAHQALHEDDSGIAGIATWRTVIGPAVSHDVPSIDELIRWDEEEEKGRKEDVT